MRFYAPGDEIYMFGFSRGAYTARFLAEMLDHVGLVSQGNEEMVMFAWKTFSDWQLRKKGWGRGKEEMSKYVSPDPLTSPPCVMFPVRQSPAVNWIDGGRYRYMTAFKDTFARPVGKVRFLGLFDTVNSVPRFENAWLRRSTGYPYLARSEPPAAPVPLLLTRRRQRAGDPPRHRHR